MENIKTTLPKRQIVICQNAKCPDLGVPQYCRAESNYQCKSCGTVLAEQEKPNPAPSFLLD